MFQTPAIMCVGHSYNRFPNAYLIRREYSGILRGDNEPVSTSLRLCILLPSQNTSKMRSSNNDRNRFCSVGGAQGSVDWWFRVPMLKTSFCVSFLRRRLCFFLGSCAKVVFELIMSFSDLPAHGKKKKRSSSNGLIGRKDNFMLHLRPVDWESYNSLPFGCWVPD